MKYATANAFRTALEANINRIAVEDGRSVQHLRKMVVFERLLARLLVVAPDRWIVKGGVALDLRLGDRARATRDLDLARHDSEAIAMEDLLDAADRDLGDFFTFTVERTETFADDRDNASVRYQIRADLANRLFEAVALDIGFGDPLPATPDLLPVPTMLGFADLAPITAPALPLEQHLAQKRHAYSRTYGAGHSSSRVKDLIDMALIRASTALSALRLREELARTFRTRGTHELPAMFPAPPEGWAPS